MKVKMKRYRKSITALSLVSIIAMCIIPANIWEVNANIVLKNPRITSGKTVTWDCVYFGSYLQSSDGNGGYITEPIKWRVLQVNNNKVLLLADKNLIAKPFNKIYLKGALWESSTIRSWLNGYGSNRNIAKADYSSDNFINEAFSASEQAAIKTTYVINDYNELIYSYGAGKDTNDKIFLLSRIDVENSIYGFSTSDYSTANKTRQAQSTDFANAHATIGWDPYRGNGNWWLRTAYDDSIGSGANCVGIDGDIYGSNVDDDYYVIRPALWIDISSEFWTYAGTVSVNASKEESFHKRTTKKYTTIASQNMVKSYGSKAFNLKAKIVGDGKVSYKSNDPKVLAVDSKGKVTIKNTGTGTITIVVAATPEYNAATKKVTITVNPKKVAGIKAKAGKKQMTVSWKKDTKATGYQLTYAQNSKFTKGKKNITISKNKTVKRTVKKLKSKKTYYVKVRAYKKAGNKKLYGAYSSVKKIKTK